MWVVQLKNPLAKIRSQVFVFYTSAEADEFASCLHATYHGVETITVEAGEATEVFDDWSF